ncbi:MAG: sialidase family protein [Vicinamibacterales bacterium]
MSCPRPEARASQRTAGLVLCTLVPALVAGACAGPTAAEAPPPDAGPAAVRVLDTPTTTGSTAYALAAGADGAAYLAWIEPVTNAGYALRFSRLENGAWSAARDIARGDDWFVNWADHASLTALPDGTLLAHWLVNTGRKEGAYGYGIRVARSSDRGDTWSTVFEDGMDNVSDYAGFLTFLPGASGAEAVYLKPLTPDDGTAAHGEEEHTKTLAAVSFAADGTPSDQQVVDDDVCSCCTTDMAVTADGLVAVYRDHLPGEIRDISIVRRVDGAWSAPARVAEDGWMIPGCPTNGPVVAARGQRVAVAWFTAAGDTPRVKLALSQDAGRTFAAPIVVDDGNPVGWPDLVMQDDGRVLVSWLERRGEGVGEVLVRRVSADGVPATPLVVAASVSGRATGIPHMIAAGETVIVAWRNERVLSAAVPLRAIP